LKIRTEKEGHEEGKNIALVGGVEGLRWSPSEPLENEEDWRAVRAV